MAAEALAAFLQRDFPRCDQALLSLSSDPNADVPNLRSLTDDPRIRHNSLVAHFYSTPSLAHLDHFLKFVSDYLPQQQRPFSLADLFATPSLDLHSVKLLDSQLGPVALYNIAIIAYHRHQVHTAATIGEHLFENIEALDEWLALSTCFLLTDVHLRLGHVNQANAVLSHADKVLPSFARQSQFTPDSSSNSTSTVRTLAPPWPGRNTAVLEFPRSYEHAKFCIHIYNARLSAAADGADGSRSIRKEAKSAVLAADDAHSRPTSAALLVKARVEQSFSKGLRILASIASQSPQHMLPKVRPLALNSLGILHHRIGRHALAACYLEHSRRAFKALYNSQDASSANSDFYLSVFSTIKDSHVAYNLALQYMKFGDFSRALDLFSTCAKCDPILASSSACLWIRIAECCVAVASRFNASECSVSTAGTGRGRRLIARSVEKRNHVYMEYAVACARSALKILDKQQSKRDATSETESMKQATRTDDKAGEEQELRAVALSLIAYAGLSFDPHAVVEACDELQKIYPKTDTERSSLVLLYAAEAYCQLGRAKDASRRLAPLLSLTVPLESHVREAAYVNIGLTHACGDDLITASRAARVSLKLFTSEPKKSRSLRREATISAAYVFLRNGEIDAARQALRMLQPYRT